MQQVLFNVPILKGLFPPDGIPIYGFGAMLFVTFILVTVWGTVRARPIGMPAVKFQDFVIWVFVSGLIGARVLYMIQYSHQFPNRGIVDILGAFFRIWEGGIIFYGSALGGAIGYGLFYWFVMRRMNVSGWQLADVVAPLLAMGLAIGRIGCYLNGCCWGQVCEPTAPVPLGAAHFPLLTAHSRGQLVSEQFLQTATGFTIRYRDRTDPRAEVAVVEPDSAAAAAGLKPGDRIVKVNDKPNLILLDAAGPEDLVKQAVEELKASGGKVRFASSARTRVEFDSLPAYVQGDQKVVPFRLQGVDFYPADSLEELVREWPRGQTSLALVVDRQGQEVALPAFTPRTVGLYPTQLYETVSMALLIFVLLAYAPFRRHDGQLMVVLMIGYAVHRFINESLRIEPVVGMGLTLSQWGSVVIFLLAVGMEAYLWRVMPSRWKPSTPPGPPAGESKPQAVASAPVAMPQPT